MRWCLAWAVVLSAGCANTGRMTNGSMRITPPANAEKASSSSVETATVDTVIPAGTTKRVVETEATSSLPALRETVYEFHAPSVEKQVVTRHVAIMSNERAPDQAVALAKVEAQERRYLLFIGIGLGIAAIAVKSLLPLWPGLWRGSAMGAILALGAWKLSEIPAWIWAVALGVSALIAFGYKRGELDQNKNGIPDFLEKK